MLPTGRLLHVSVALGWVLLIGAVGVQRRMTDPTAARVNLCSIASSIISSSHHHRIIINAPNTPTPRRQDAR